MHLSTIILTETYISETEYELLLLCPTEVTLSNAPVCPYLRLSRRELVGVIISFVYVIVKKFSAELKPRFRSDH